MSATHEKIKQIEGLTTHGATLTEAVAKALGGTLTDFADRHDFRREEVTMCLLGYHQRTYSEIRDAICAELQIPREYLDRLIQQQKEVA